MKPKLKVTQVRSGIGRPEAQRKVLAGLGRDQKQRQVMRGLGLRRMNASVVVDNKPAFRGMIKKVIHLVSVEEVDA